MRRRTLTRGMKRKILMYEEEDTYMGKEEEDTYMGNEEEDTEI